MYFSDSHSKSGLQTKVQPVKIIPKNQKLTIGIPAENKSEEKRVVLTPDDVKAISKLGYQIYIEQGAGVEANFSDLAYSENGAKIIEDKKIIFKDCDIIVKIAPLSDEEVSFLSPNKVVFSALQMSTQTQEKIKKLKDKKITALSYELFNDENGFNPFLHIIGEIIGSSSVMIAAELMSNTFGGKGLMLGGLTGLAPTEIIVLGSDISSQYAVRIALGLGANVKVFDSSIKRLIKFHDFFGQHLYTSTITSSDLKNSLKTADVVINTLEKEHGQGFVISKEMLLEMKQGAVIVDLKVDSGSVIESSKITTFEKPTFIESEITHYCVPNIASRVARTSSVAISNIISPLLAKILNYGGIIPFIQENISYRNGVYLLKGIVTNKIIAENFDLDYTDINLIIHVF
ncbi:MAG: alanine dehydrogenase [Bacteroidales bacterium]|nr:alanine dehydrogenase [Bacteroidales bacterium]